MKMLIICLLVCLKAYPAARIDYVNDDGTKTSYDPDKYEIKRKKDPKTKSSSDYSSKKFKLKSNSISLYMGRGPTHIATEHNPYSGVTKYYQGYDNIYGLGLSARLTESFHLEMIGLSNDTIMSGFKFEFGSP